MYVVIAVSAVCGLGRRWDRFTWMRMRGHLPNFYRNSLSSWLTLNFAESELWQIRPITSIYIIQSARHPVRLHIKTCMNYKRWKVYIFHHQCNCWTLHWQWYMGGQTGKAHRTCALIAGPGVLRKNSKTQSETLPWKVWKCYVNKASWTNKYFIHEMELVVHSHEIRFATMGHEALTARCPWRSSAVSIASREKTVWGGVLVL